MLECCCVIQYEYGVYVAYARDVESRRLEILPPWEQVTLQDHRNRMATYHTDRALQNLRYVSYITTIQ
jgi:phosphodiesterase/alkaline phosphatase D-like protein